jgi:hypothetical protein
MTHLGKGELTMSIFFIEDIQSKCLETYKNTYTDCVDDFVFRERLEEIYNTKFYISKDIDICEIFSDYYYEKNLSNVDFCKEYNIQYEKDSQ